MIEPANRPTNDVTELAKERSRQAFERTLLSWINSALLLIGLGVAVGELPGRGPILAGGLLGRRLGVSLGAIALGIILLIPIAIVHRVYLQALERGDYLARPLPRVNVLVVVAIVVVFGLVAMIDVLLAIP
ncbi:DUF202 domain-containing protein [Nodosilinea sp. P-1105]|uniref:YidH family protein n=1 Tax=Nodosilinea sp. P-1105 TaxID=2546229 RepID=UPI00146A8810|nr:DUF202 domain-containing protein [Nodosilinea sp. P-1105]NMF86154.1 DUF202 domain-containing protein [Nodosilinea sp. P-1105]